VAHRVVHGGDRFLAPTLLTPEVVDRIRELSPLAPLHNPPALEGIDAARRLGVPQAAVFDTAFHRTMPPYAERYALPEALCREHGLRRYGFHGLSHQYLARRYAEITGDPRPTIVTLHLGNGASAAAIREGTCVDTSMGVTPLEGLVMGTRAGDLDPGIVIRLQRRGMGLDDVERLLWREAGLQGLAGTRDVRELLLREDPDARLAVEMFCYRARKYVGAYFAALGGAEAVVFSGGIGENSPEIRARILGKLAFLGIELDAERNARDAERISADSARVGAYVIATNEEIVVAWEALRVLAGSTP
jgi:acetate kinase